MRLGVQEGRFQSALSAFCETAYEEWIGDQLSTASVPASLNYLKLPGRDGRLRNMG